MSTDEHRPERRIEDHPLLKAGDGTPYDAGGNTLTAHFARIDARKKGLTLQDKWRMDSEDGGVRIVKPAPGHGADPGGDIAAIRAEGARRGVAIDFSEVRSMVLATFAYIRIGSRAEVVLEDGVLALRRELAAVADAAVDATPAVIGELNSLFAECDVCGWERDYEPVGYIVCDGYGWELSLAFEDGSVLESEGSNAWPETFGPLWNGLCSMLGVEGGWENPFERDGKTDYKEEGVS